MSKDFEIVQKLIDIRIRDIIELVSEYHQENHPAAYEKSCEEVNFLYGMDAMAHQLSLQNFITKRQYKLIDQKTTEAITKIQSFK